MRPDPFKARQTSPALAKPTNRNSPSVQKVEPSRLSLVGEKLNRFDLSDPAKDIILASWRSGTSKQYKSYLDRWKSYCSDHEIDMFNPGLENAIEFLTQLFSSGIGYSAINTARSALPSIITLSRGTPIGEHPLICRFVKGVFELRPSLPKYTEIWDVAIVLNYLKTLDPPQGLTLKNLTLKTSTLLCLLSGQRC